MTAADADRRPGGGRLRRQVRAILSSPPRLRQALLLQEVLGPPVALRRRDERPPRGR